MEQDSDDEADPCIYFPPVRCCRRVNAGVRQQRYRAEESAHRDR